MTSAASSPPDAPADTRMTYGRRPAIPVTPSQMPPRQPSSFAPPQGPAPQAQNDVLYNLVRGAMLDENALRELSAEDARDRGFPQQALTFLIHQQLEQIIGRWQAPPKSPIREKWTINAVGQPLPIKTHGMLFCAIYCPGAFPISLLIEEQGMAATVVLNPGWNPLSITDQSMVSIAPGSPSPTTFIFELSDRGPQPQAGQIAPQGVFAPTIGWVAPQAGAVSVDASGVKYAQILESVQLQAGGNNQVNNSNAFWAAAVVGAGGTSASVSIPGYGKVRIFVTTSVADTFNVQISDDGGTTWYTLTQDNAGTPLIIATTATQLSSCRDISTFGASNLRLLAIGAATITAGYQAEVV